jgi:hypothetical protein
MVMGQTVRSIVHANVGIFTMLLIAVIVFAVCIFQFIFGKKVGERYDRRITAGQAVGQRNTSFAIWMALTYLNPVSAVGSRLLCHCSECSEQLGIVESCARKKDIRNLLYFLLHHPFRSFLIFSCSSCSILFKRLFGNVYRRTDE